MTTVGVQVLHPDSIIKEKPMLGEEGFERPCSAGSVVRGIVHRQSGESNKKSFYSRNTRLLDDDKGGSGASEGT
jgi:hypothetical protein